MRRLDSVSKSPIYAFFSEAVEGLATIRGLGASRLFVERSDANLRRYQRAAFSGLAVSQWLAVRLQLVSALVITVLGMLFVAERSMIQFDQPGKHGKKHHNSTSWAAHVLHQGLDLSMLPAELGIPIGGIPVVAGLPEAPRPSGSIVPSFWNFTVTASMLASLLGLSLSYALPLTGLLNGLLTTSAEVEQEMVSLERVAEYVEQASVMTLQHQGGDAAVLEAPGGATPRLISPALSPVLSAVAAPGRENLQSLTDLDEFIAQRRGSAALYRAQEVLAQGPKGEADLEPGPDTSLNPAVSSRRVAGSTTEIDQRVIYLAHRASYSLELWLARAREAVAWLWGGPAGGAQPGARPARPAPLHVPEAPGSGVPSSALASPVVRPGGASSAAGSVAPSPLQSPRSGDPSRAVRLFRSSSRFQLGRSGNGVIFDGVFLRYGPDLPWALDGVSFRVEGASRTAIVGRTGSGKSTCVSALLGLYSIQEGSIQIGGRDIRDYSPRWLRG